MISNVFSADGLLAKKVKGFSPRKQQQQMAEEIARIIEGKKILVAEAGTGTGKTFAYLAPALLSGKKIILSTGTKALQDQLFYRDLPLVCEALDIPVKTALLKGRANYLCHYRLDQNRSFPELDYQEFNNHQFYNQLSNIKDWSGYTKTGDISEFNDLPEDAPIWPFVTSTTENCIGQDCPNLSECFVAKARREAYDADVLVINHHLLFADLALRDEGFGQLLPGANAIIVDEAHQLMEIAPQFFGSSVSSRRIRGLLQDIKTELLAIDYECPELDEITQNVELSLEKLHQAIGKRPLKLGWHDLDNREAAEKSSAELLSELATLKDHLDEASVRSKGLYNCWQRCQTLAETLSLCVNADESSGEIIWLDVFSSSFVINRMPMDISSVMREHIEQSDSGWVFLSATLAVNKSFEYFNKQLGLDDADTRLWDSPFDYHTNALLYIPEDLPSPQDSNYTKMLVDAAIPVINASRGRAFMLFTSHRALRLATELLKGRLDYPLLVQGSVTRNKLVEKFRNHGNAVLLGTASFWEGIDVRGESLSCVIIDKLPFASPADPVQKAKIGLIRQKGDDPFTSYQLPKAVIMLKQGIGRLIRDETDTGVLMLCDPRLYSKPYGKVFLRSLPDMKVTRNQVDVEKFFATDESRQVVEI